MRSLGICIDCGAADAVKGYVRCADCLYKQYLYKMKYNATHDKEKLKKQRAITSKERRKRLKEAGLCTQCGQKQAYKGGLCVECRTKAINSRYKYYVPTGAKEVWRMYGLCPICGGKPVEGYKVCASCLERIRNAQRKSDKTQFKGENELFYQQFQSKGTDK